MRERIDIVRAWNDARARGEDCVLVTVVKVEGSAYRREGARLLIRANGERVGSVSGGCLEYDLVRKSFFWTREGTNVMRVYDTRAEQGEEIAYGLGCGGAVHLLVERITVANDIAVRLLSEVANCNRDARIATVVRSGNDELEGHRAILLPTGEIEFSSLSPNELRQVLHHSLHSDERAQRVDVAGTWAEICVETVSPPQRLVIFGAGYDAVPMVHTAKTLGWHVTVADGRSHYARRERFLEADAVVHLGGDADPASLVDERTAVVVMTHSFDQDREIVRSLLSQSLLYLGVLGSHRRTEQILRETFNIGLQDARAQYAHFHAPLGLSIASDSPEEIALAAIAQVQQVRLQKSQQALPDRQTDTEDSPWNACRMQ